MTTMERLVDVFVRVFEDEVEASAIRPESKLIDDLGLNSIGMLYMAMELENEFGIGTYPMNWPIGVDGDFQGVYHRDTETITLYSGNS